MQAPKEAILAGPNVRWDHIDGPLMVWGGHCHWLTRRERFLIWIGRRTVDEIAYTHWPHLKRLRDTIRKEPR